MAPKVSAGHLRRDRTEVLTERAQRLRCCDAKDCTASTVAARQSPQAASALACCPSFSRPLRALEPPSDLIPPPVQCGDSCALCAMIIIRLRPHMAGLRPAGSHCEKERKDSYAPLHSARNDKSCHPQEEVQTNSDTGIAPASPSKQRRKRPCPIGFRHICPKTEKIIRNFAGQSINCRARI